MCVHNIGSLPVLRKNGKPVSRERSLFLRYNDGERKFRILSR